jgi:hypothetical protein
MLRLSKSLVKKKIYACARVTEILISGWRARTRRNFFFTKHKLSHTEQSDETQAGIARGGMGLS